MRLGQPPMATRSAIDAPPPGPGEVRHTALPDTFDGIRFEIGRMIRYVQAAVDDPILVEHVRGVCEARGAGAPWMAARDGREPDPSSGCLEAIEEACRATFVYVNDPPNIEVVQTPRRMHQITRIPPEAIREVIEPFYDAMRTVHDPAVVDDYEPPGVCSGDCDEGSAYFLALCACAAARLGADIGPLRFRFGGHDGTLHHVWSYVRCGGKWNDSDLTEPAYRLGDHSRFAHYEEVEVPL
jgi:hypothetical protein